jgi:hypothetical protein
VTARYCCSAGGTVAEPNASTKVVIQDSLKLYGQLDAVSIHQKSSRRLPHTSA